MRKLALSLVVVAAVLASPAAAGGPKLVKVDDNFFKPTRVSILKNQKVTWQWKGSDLHNVAVFKPGTVPFEDDPKKRSRVKTKGDFTHQFRSTGTWKAFCEVHPNSMTMKVVVKRG